MQFKPLTVSTVALLGVFGFFMASAKPENVTVPKVTKEGKIKLALEQAELKTIKNEVEGDGEKKRVLVFSKTNGYRHKSIGIGKKTLELMAESTGVFDVVISDDLGNFDNENIGNFDAICFLNTTKDVFAPKKGEFERMSPEEKKVASELEITRKGNLMRFIENGNGFIGIHSASDTFYEWPEYGEMLGGYFDGHPWTSNMEVSIKADERNKDHALLSGVIPEGLEELRFKEEVYQLKAPYDSKKLTMLLRLDSDASDKPRGGIKRKDKDFGVSWIKPHKNGRVFYCSLGHNEHIYWNKHVLRHYYAGIMYALGEDARGE